jgi:hypothetical protein
MHDPEIRIKKICKTPYYKKMTYRIHDPRIIIKKNMQNTVL